MNFDTYRIFFGIKQKIFPIKSLKDHKINETQNY